MSENARERRAAAPRVGRRAALGRVRDPLVDQISARSALGTWNPVDQSINAEPMAQHRRADRPLNTKCWSTRLRWQWLQQGGEINMSVRTSSQLIDLLVI